MNALMEELGRPAKQCRLQILGFPCNQFGFQEPGENAAEIYNGLKYCRPGNGFVPNFQLLQKRDVNGAKEDEIFTFLKERCPTQDGIVAKLKDITWSPVKNNDIAWNFEKFLIDHEGKPYRRYSHMVQAKDLQNDIKELMLKCLS